MKRTAQVLSYLALAATVLAALLFFADRLELRQAQLGLLLAALLWFLTAPFWMEHKATE